MRLSRFNRWLHHWLSIIIVLPIGLVIVTGILLQLKKELAWVQPVEQRGRGTVPAVAFEQLLAATMQALPDEVRGWPDIERVDVRPAKGLAKLTTHARTEVQIDLADGRVLQVAHRRSDLIEALHDGSWFHAQAKYWVFLPAAIALLASWVTGIYLFVLPYLVRARRRRDRRPPS
jgi:uncharacterized iron-regulated membrane protein